MEHEILVLPARNCRRSKKVIEFLRTHEIPFRQVELESPEGQKYVERFGLRASPGLIVDGVSINPYEILIQKECRVDTDKALAVFVATRKDQE